MNSYLTDFEKLQKNKNRLISTQQSLPNIPKTKTVSSHPVLPSIKQILQQNSQTKSIDARAIVCIKQHISIYENFILNVQIECFYQ